jgi:hypothetical protein
MQNTISRLGLNSREMNNLKGGRVSVLSILNLYLLNLLIGILIISLILVIG